MNQKLLHTPEGVRDIYGTEYKKKLVIEDMLDDGRAFGRYEGCAVFVSGGAVPGDEVKVKLTKAKKSSAEGVMTEIISASPDRIPAECPYAGSCGGCFNHRSPCCGRRCGGRS